MNIDDTTQRNQRILDEVQPLAKRIMNSFIANYSESDSYLLQLKIHTYEQTLKTTIAEYSRNGWNNYLANNSIINLRIYVDTVNSEC